ncbi:MAG: DUF2073 domain-containing protein [Candidatus Altiarchaeota archaeon]|nr:DUF2073 domain-containing protein [Candidatus Altiarchaeota archaeon]
MDIEIQFISTQVIKDMGREEKVEYVLKQVKENKIIVLEEGMSPIEESALIEATMEQVTKKFPGIEVSTLKERKDDGIREKLIRILGGNTGGLTVIGPSKIIKEIKKDPRHITMFASGIEEKKKKKK